MPSRRPLLARAEAVVEEARRVATRNHALLEQARASARPLRETALRRGPDPDAGSAAPRGPDAPPAA